MKKLSKTDIKERDELVSYLRTKSEVVHDRVQEVNEAIQSLNDAISDYNATINDANEWAQQLVGQMEDFKEAKSEKWQDSDTGQQYDSWIQQWADDLEEIDEVPDVDAPDMNAADDLENRPEGLEE